MWKKALRWLAIVLAVLLAGAGGFVYAQVAAFDASMAKVYDVPPPKLSASTDPAVIARGRHLAESIGGCMSCHGDDLGGKPGEDMGPIGVLTAPNLTAGQHGIGKRYSDGQLALLIRDGITADRRSLRFMPAQDLSWWPDDDVVALISFIRSLPAVDRDAGPSHLGMLAKVLDRMDAFVVDVARRIDHTRQRPKSLPPQPTAAYGANLGKLCMGCHGLTLSGGPIPGAPPEMPTPTNITPHETGIKAYTEDDFRKLLDTGIRPDGEKLDPFMPIATLRAMDEIEKRALWAYLRSLPPKPFGGR